MSHVREETRKRGEKKGGKVRRGVMEREKKGLMFEVEAENVRRERTNEKTREQTREDKGIS